MSDTTTNATSTVIDSKEIFPALTGLRAPLMYMVFINHFNPFLKTDPQGFVVRFIGEFYVALIMFFVLSGFLITYRYIDRPRTFRVYMINRVARVYPVYFLATTLTLLVAPERMSDTNGTLSPWIVYLSNITFLRGFFSDLLFSGVAQGWSLTPEEVFYVTAPLMFLLVRRSLLSLLLVPPALFVVGLVLVRLFGGSDSHGFMADNRFMMVGTIFGLSATFCAGVGLAMIYIRYRDRIRGRHFTLIGGCATLAAMVASAALKGDLAIGVYHPVGFIVMIVLLPPLGTGLFLWGLMTEVTWLSRLLSTRVAIVLGQCSLSFYMLHLGVLSDAWLDFWPSYGAWCVVVTVLSVVLFATVEQPADHFIRRLGRIDWRRPQRHKDDGHPRSA